MTSPAFADIAFRPRALVWTAAFLALLAALLFPLIMLAARAGRDVTIWEQAGVIAVATIAVQLLRRATIWEVTGRPTLGWLRELAIGMALGTALMLAPALFLAIGGWVDFRPTGTGASGLLQAVLLMAGVAIAEELLFRGVLFQRLIDAFGVWPAQLLLAGLFVLTHLGNPGMEGATKVWAGVNIFAASLLFGMAYLRTRSLALPIGLHFMANVTQGIVLGFGVSGASEPSLLAPGFLVQADWLTGGRFGLEASLPGLVAVLGLLLLVWRWRRRPLGPIAGS
ncbi:MAG TPA: CPBP family intramembrane glutamic endopeptidase [Caulobacteraceae bacterium]|nr:CPBP family intramembrane glutamic endopeptidase [Caulobacteraceae bacterium]